MEAGFFSRSLDRTPTTARCLRVDTNKTQSQKGLSLVGKKSLSSIPAFAFFIAQLYQLIQDYGIPLAEVARRLGVSMSAISKAITR
ncbi:MAG: hypothetical protein LWX01_09445, partial [Deltaproteobacteria bacterium]|nr:hypothetical protein [Deltaproteobacteria bacterium]